MLKMMRLYTTNVQSGMIVAEDVFSPNGMLVVAAETVINERTLQLLDRYGVISLNVLVDENFSIETKVDEVTHSQKIRNSPKFKAFKKSIEEKADSLKKTFSDVIEKSLQIDPQNILDDVEDILSGINTTGEVFDFLNILRDNDDATYTHCINVALLCNIFSRWINLPEEEIKVVVVAGMLHDIGKVKVAQEILMKPARLTENEYEDIKKHTIYGFKILEKQVDLDPRIKMTALLHHERCDGRGYPQRRRIEELDLVTRIVAIADVYEAMTADRCYRKKLCPFDVIQMFEREGLTQFDPELVLSFLERIAQTQLNARIRLNNGDTAEIVFINRLELSRPIIKTSSGIIDLTDRPDLKIVEVLI